jgi:pilus assembly protein Flp/PilA
MRLWEIVSCNLELKNMSGIQRFVRGEGGATAIEYALIASLIALVLVGVLTSLGAALSSEFGEVSSALK